MFEVVRTSKKRQIDETDVISVEEAARISDRAITVITNMLDRGRLPWYQFRPIDALMEGERVQRFTSRSAVEKLPKEKKIRKPAKK